MKVPLHLGIFCENSSFSPFPLYHCWLLHPRWWRVFFQWMLFLIYCLWLSQFLKKKKLVNANSLFSRQKMSSKFNASLDAIKSITSLNIDTNSLANTAAILNKSTWSQNIFMVCKGMWNSVWLLVFPCSCYERHCSNKCSVVLLE